MSNKSLIDKEADLASFKVVLKNYANLISLFCAHKL